MTEMRANIEGVGGEVASPSSYVVDDLYWGYKVRTTGGPSLGVALGQAVSFFFGVCFLTACLGILVLPTLFFDGEIGAMRIGAAALFGAMAAYLLWFASRGTHPEVHVDTNMGEVRQVVCNRAGRPTTVETFAFDEISGVFVEENHETGAAQLILHYRDADKAVSVAKATTAQLIPLRDRLANDLMQPPKLQSTAA